LKSVAENTVLGIDPGTNVMGYGIINFTGAQVKLIEMGVLKLHKHEDTHKRLAIIYNKVKELIKNHQPDFFAIEAPFYAKNVQSMLKLGRAQGVAIAAASEANIQILEFMPKRIKQAITGNGNASKEQVWKMLQYNLQFQETPEFLDATDALAVAMTMFYELQNPIASQIQKSGDWSDFIKKNPNRIVKP
jgi:crossover junction endodeoxyribonuclease RuvC